MQLVMFSKMFGGLSIDHMGEIIANLGFDGVDLTVRPGGHVLPERVGEDLPRAVEILHEQRLAVPMITTALTDPNDPTVEAIFNVASKVGVTYLKLGYWPYRGFGHLKRQVEEVRGQLRGFEGPARQYGIRAAVHIHSGNYMSAEAGVLAMLLDGLDVGAYIDPGHMTVEGGLGGWRIGMDLLAEKITMVGVKDFGWYRVEETTGEVRWRTRWVPFKEGMVAWPEVFRYLRAIGFNGPVSAHSEYDWRDLSFMELIEQTREDVAYLRTVMG
ncbi:MAG: sugar phosphate isomerase/epimerase [Candidatus Latescibacteria bacterium]|nr:sugar phosphate isomerase/epimerase [Candidatus Latescibacterota bacterium]